MVPSKFIDDNLNRICNGSSLVVPKTALELKKITKSIENSMSNQNIQNIRIYTDYKRRNTTHFWSETVKDWWNLKNESQEKVSEKIYVQYMYCYSGSNILCDPN